MALPPSTRLQPLVASLPAHVAGPVQAAMRAQDDFNVAVQQTLAPFLAPAIWTPLTPINGWVPFGAGDFGWNSPAWMQDTSGRVWLKGAIGGGSNSVDIFSKGLPAPSNAWRFIVYCDDGSTPAIGDIVVLKTGNLQLLHGSVVFVSLDAVTYLP